MTAPAVRLPAPADSAAPSPLEVAAWIALLALSCSLRFTDLGARPLHHDESLFAYYTWRIAAHGDYEYMPILHGPMYLYKTALLFLAFGDSVAVARGWMAAFGALMPLFALLFRRRWGPGATWLAGAFVALSPVLLFYQRFFRHDIPLATWTLVEIALALWWWRRPASHLRGALLGAAILLPLGIKENWLITQFVFFGFLHLRVAADVPRLAPAWASLRRAAPAATAGFFDAPPFGRGDLLRLAAAAATWAVVAVLLLGALFFPAEVRRPSAALAAGVVLLWLDAAAVAAAVLLAWRLGPDAADASFTARLARGLAASWTGFVTGAALATLLLQLLFTHGLRYPEAPNSAFRRTFEYWLGEHKKHRLKGPFHFYATILATYHWPQMLLAGGAAAAWVARRGGGLARRVGAGLAGLGVLAAAWELAPVGFPTVAFYEALDARLHMTSLVHVWAALLLVAGGALYALARLGEGRPVLAFFAFWTCWAAALYGYAGEKVPWIGVHVAQPLLWWAAAELAALRGRRESPDAADPASPMPDPAPRRAAPWRRAAAVAAASALLALHVVDARRLVAGDVTHPRERIVFNHTTPQAVEVTRLFRELLAERRAAGGDARFDFRGDVGWPYFFYLRDLPGIAQTFPLHELPWVEVIVTNPSRVGSDGELDPATLDDSHAWFELPFRRSWVPALLPIPRMLGLASWRPAPGTLHAWHLTEGDAEVGGARAWALLWRYMTRREPWFDPERPHGVLAAEEAGTEQVLWLGVRREVLRERTAAAERLRAFVTSLRAVEGTTPEPPRGAGAPR